MKKKQGFSNMYLNMLRALVACLFNSAYIAIVNSLVPFKNGAAILKSNLATVDDLRSQAKAVIKGQAALKRSLRKATTGISYNIMKSVFAFGVNTKNQIIISAMTITKREVNKMKMPAFIEFIQAAIDTVSPLVEAGSLTDYNVTEENIENWQTILDQLKNIDSAPTNAIKHRKMLNDQASDLLGQTLTYIREIMDPLSLNFAQSENAFFREYLNNRRLTNISVHTKFKVHVTNDVNEPQVNIPVSQNDTTIKAFTDINGDATVMVKVNEGENAQPIYYFTIGSGTTAKQTGPIEIKKGHTVSKQYIIKQSGLIVPAPQETPQTQNA